MPDARARKRFQVFGQALCAARLGSADSGFGIPAAIPPTPGKYVAHRLPEGGFACAAQPGGRPANDSRVRY